MASSVSKLIPKDPEKSMTIRLVTPTILICSTQFFRAGKIKLGGRGTIVKMANNDLAVFSPVALTERVKTQMQQQLGSTNVKYLGALDQEHHIFLEEWLKEYPNARVIAPDTLPGYRDKQGYFKIPQQNWVLAQPDEKLRVDEAFDKEFDSVYIHGHRNKEVIFNHRPTRTMIEADYIFNLPAFEQHGPEATTGILTKIFNYLTGTTGDATAQRRMIWYGPAVGDKASFTEGAVEIDKWDFDRIIPCHGEVIDTNGKDVFRKVMRWYLEAGKKNEAGK